MGGYSGSPPFNPAVCESGRARSGAFFNSSRSDGREARRKSFWSSYRSCELWPGGEMPGETFVRLGLPTVHEPMYPLQPLHRQPRVNRQLQPLPYSQLSADCIAKMVSTLGSDHTTAANDSLGWPLQEDPVSEQPPPSPTHFTSVELTRQRKLPKACLVARRWLVLPTGKLEAKHRHRRLLHIRHHGHPVEGQR